MQVFYDMRQAGISRSFYPVFAFIVLFHNYFPDMIVYTVHTRANHPKMGAFWYLSLACYLFS